ncbi:MAG TPA: response regulator [Myxococcota bacterium]|nr:response regulator [Myxococcota bacterium]
MSEPTIVLIDDDWDDIAVALRAARREQLPVEISVFQDARDVLDALGVDGNGGSNGKAYLHPRAIFLDLRMPRIDGWEILRRLRASPRTRDVPVIVQSWSTRAEDIERCYALGANSFVAKRVAPGRPGLYFTDAVRYWIQLNQTPASVSRYRGA